MCELKSKFHNTFRVHRLRNSVTLLVLLASGFWSSASNAKSDCSNPAYESQAKQNECAVLRYEAADKALNNQYNRALGRLAKAQQKELALEQRDWLRKLDPSCKESLGDPDKAGNMWSMEFHECLAQETDIRTRILKDLLFK
jgi:uncharacterized protein YecT (DUF1311 family)